jgi:hypothetical protein
MWLSTGIVAAGAAAVMGVYSQGRRTPELSTPATVTFRILLGVGDKEPATWDGKVSATGAEVTSIRGWRFAGTDQSDYKTSWRVSTRYGLARKQGRGPMQENGVLVGARTSSEDARFDVTTAQGNFSFTARQVPFGETRMELGGRVQIERVPASTQLTTSVEEQDHPAIASSGDDVWVAYVEFVHGDRQYERRGQLEQEPKDFDFLARPAGGDQVRLVQFSKSKRVWSAAEAVSETKQDIMRTAVAVDGSKQVWVIWSANRGGNFDLYAKVKSGGKWSKEVRLTSDSGTDINPVAATDAKGRVWVAWQGFRNGNLEILAAVQEGEKFGREALISASKMSDWDASIAAARNGEVAVAWDTYEKGDYDVYLRRMRFDGGLKMEAPQVVAASRNFEARPSVAYDPQNRPWVAYEGADVKWGKDFGAYETTGVALYAGHGIKLRCVEKDSLSTTEPDLETVLPGPMNARRTRRGQAQGPEPRKLPDPELASQRAPGATPQPGPLPRSSFPRLAVDPAGTIYLAFRSSAGGRSPVGTIWNGNLVYHDGAKWNGPVAIPNTDGLLDSRPAMAALANGHLMIAATSDHRQSSAASPGAGRRGSDEINTDIYAAELQMASAAKPVNLRPWAEPKAEPDAEVAAERAQVTLMRGHRVKVAGTEMQLMRGEFHRHTEISGDGGGDGPVIDAYRYMIDAAYMDWGGCCDHDNGGGREYYWWIEQKLTDAYWLGANYVPMFSYERSVRYPEGHRNVVMAQRGVRPLPRLPKVADEAPPAPAPDMQMLYRYLRRFDGVVAVHTSGTNMGTDWRDNDPLLEPMVEIYQGDRQNYEMPDAPRSNNDKDSIGGWRPLGFVSLALAKGYRMGFQASSDHISTHMSYCNLWVTKPTREGLMEAFRKRRIYGATDNILADVRSGQHFMGEEFSTNDAPALAVKLWGTDRFAKVHIIKDGAYAYTAEPNAKTVDFTWKDNAAVKGKTSYYYVRGEQADGEIVWVSPMWIEYR